MKSRTLCAAGTFVGLLSQSAFGQLQPQTPTGSRIPVKPETITGERAGAMRMGFAKCLFSRNPAAVNRILAATDPGSVDPPASFAKSRKWDADLSMSTCLGRVAEPLANEIGWKSDFATLREMMLEAAYLGTVKSLESAPTTIPLVTRKYVSTGDVQKNAEARAIVADCVVEKNASGADQVVRTTPGSKAELKAARALAPTLGECLPTGQTFKLDLPNVRGFAAEGLWQRYVAPHVISALAETGSHANA